MQITEKTSNHAGNLVIVPSCRGLGNYRENDPRRMLRIVIHGIFSDAPTPALIERIPCVGVYVEPWKVAAGNIQPNAMTATKNQRGGIHLDRELERTSR